MLYSVHRHNLLQYYLLLLLLFLPWLWLYVTASSLLLLMLVWLRLLKHRCIYWPSVPAGHVNALRSSLYRMRQHVAACGEHDNVNSS